MSNVLDHAREPTAALENYRDNGICFNVLPHLINWH